MSKEEPKKKKVESPMLLLYIGIFSIATCLIFLLDSGSQTPAISSIYATESGTRKLLKDPVTGNCMRDWLSNRAHEYEFCFISGDCGTIPLVTNEDLKDALDNICRPAADAIAQSWLVRYKR